MRTEHMALLVLSLCLSLCTAQKVHDISYALVSEITKKNMRHCDRLAILLLFFFHSLFVMTDELTAVNADD